MHELAVPCPPHSFDEPSARDAVRRPLPVVPRHVALDVRVDLDARRVTGTVTHHVRVRRACAQFTLDAVDLEITAVRVGGEPAEFTVHAEGVDVAVEAVAGDELVLTVEFVASRPAAGLYFIAADAEHPAQAWTQGAMEDHQHWFPCFDAPQHLVTTAVRATVPPAYTALSNGVLVDSETADAGWRTFHWKHETPHALYLLTLVVDQVSEVTGRHGETTLHHYVPAGREADAEAAFARLGQMLDFFAEATGRPYPYPRYGHAFLREFMWGGMENTTLTSLTDAVLVPAEHVEEEDVERLIAHELAHQWFGDLIAPRGWPEIWLNESFATYFEQRCMRALNGDDDFHRRMAGERASYLGEARDRYARPVVTRRYAHPYVLFDRHAYEKGCLVLHMLRSQLGAEVFDAGVRTYVARCAGTAAETADLRRALEDASGEDLTDFFEHWVYGAAHAKATVTWRWSERTGTEVCVERTDEMEGAPEVTVQAGEAAVRVRLQPGRTVVAVSGPRPRWVAVDPWAEALLELDESRESDAALRARLEAPVTPLQMRTAALLGQRSTPRNRDALIQALDAGVAVGVAAARALGEHRSEAAREALAKVVASDGHWRIRAAAAEALGVGAEPDGVSRFGELLETCDRHRVRCGLIAGLGNIKDPRAAELIRSQLPIESPKHCVRAAAIAALAAQEKPEYVDEISAYAGPEHPRQVRQAALAALGRLAKLESVAKSTRRRLREHLERELRADNFFVRVSAVAALKRLANKRSRGALKRAHGAEQFAFIRRRIREALGAIDA